MRHPVVLATMLFCILLAVCACAPALDPSLDLSQYAHTAWKVREGFAKGSILAIAQTPDGYLWLGTELGLLRFDGVRAVPWQPPNGEQLPSNYITRLLVADDGTLWIGTLKGLVSWKDGKLTQHREAAGLIVGALFEDREQTVWFAVYESSKARLCAIRGGKVECQGAGIFGSAVTALYEDHGHNLWVSAQTGLWRWAPGPPQRYTFPQDVIEANSLIEDDNGTLLLATNGGLKRLVAGRIENYSLAGISGQFRPTTFLRSSEGSLWIGTQQGLLHLHRGRVDGFRALDGLSGDPVTRILQDREGNVWVGTIDGLDRFREYPIPTISRNQGLSSSDAWSTQATPDGSIWMGAVDGLNRWANGHLTVYRGQSALTESSRRDKTDLNTSGTAAEIENSGLAGTPQSLGLDDAGRLWVSTSDGVFYLEGGRFIRVPDVPGGNISSIAGDGHGNLWILKPVAGIFYWSPKAAVQKTPLSQFAPKTARTVLPDREPGGLWLGFMEGGLVYLRDGKAVRSYGPADGLGEGRVTHLRFGPNGGLWASTEGGLSRINNGHIATLTHKNGLPCDEVHWSIEDNDHAVWLYMPCGLVRIARSELDAWINDPKHVLKTTIFDTSDGVRSVGVYGGYGPHVTKSPDGRIWFLPQDGVSVIDPHHLLFNELLPPVHVEQVIADRKLYWENWSDDAPSNFRLPPLVRELEIDYTALSLVAPEKVLFRYKLEGWDQDWQDAGTRRQAFYGNLPPRKYTFRVKACNNSGLWNETGASFDFSVSPAYYQTYLFRLTCFAAFVALLWAGYRLRVHQLQEQEKKFRDAIETMPALAFVADSKGNRTFLNRGWLEYTGLSSEQASGSGWERAVHPDDLKRVIERWRKSQTTGEPLDYEVRLRRGSDGVYRWFLTRARPLRDNRGKIVKWCAVATDIEDRKDAEQLRADLTHASRVSTMGELVASISHELAQPLTATTNNAKASLRWLQHDPPNLMQVRKGTERIIEAGTLASEIINRLRSLYKKSSPKRESVSINEVIGEMVPMLRSEANEYAISIRTDLAADLPKIMADRVQLQQVLMNLILNGIEAMKDTGGVLTMKSQLAEDGQIQISIHDTGPGLPIGKDDEIFDAFFTTKPQGSGMGLSISKSIVEAHGGRIWATVNEGRGATFHFTMPAAPAETNPPADAA